MHAAALAPAAAELVSPAGAERSDWSGTVAAAAPPPARLLLVRMPSASLFTWQSHSESREQKGPAPAEKQPPAPSAERHVTPNCFKSIIATPRVPGVIAVIAGAPAAAHMPPPRMRRTGNRKVFMVICSACGVSVGWLRW
eukprot:SAG22_NODE_370_length_11576_cov_83.771456_2_plen_140_part_00